MAFQDIIKVEKPEHYIGVAFRRGRDKITATRQKARGPNIEKSKTIELARLRVVKQSLQKALDKIIKGFPSFNTMPDFYRELARCTLDYGQTKKALGAMGWASGQIEKLHGFYSTKIKRAREISSVNSFRREFYGRVSSVMKQIKKELQILHETRQVMRGYPTLKTEMFTVALFGFPNVGKTTLLTKLSPSKPEIAAYPFTTKGINVGYAMWGSKRVQVIDTPGTLNRFEKMNNIEMQAHLALNHLANQIVYVFDLTEPYPLKDQIKLYKMVKRMEKPVVIYLSKCDILDKETVSEFKKKYDVFTDSEKLKDYLLSLA